MKPPNADHVKPAMIVQVDCLVSKVEGNEHRRLLLALPFKKADNAAEQRKAVEAAFDEVAKLYFAHEASPALEWKVLTIGVTHQLTFYVEPSPIVQLVH